MIKITHITPPRVDEASLAGVDISKYDASKLEKYVVQSGDYVFAMTGATIGKIGRLYKGEAYINQRVLTFRNKESIINKDFLYYVLLKDDFAKYVYNHIDSESAQPNISANTVAKYTFDLPPIEKQKEIAKILSALDDKIELNNAINRNLEEQAQALFKSWFIDFEPFGENEFVDSPIDLKIPKSLKMIQIEGIPHTLETGRRPKGGAVSEGIPSIGAENVKQFGVFDFSSNKFIPREFAESLGKGKINGYELLLYKDGGKPGTFMPHFSMFGEGFPYEECYINEHVFKLDFGDKGLNIFAYFYFQTDYVVSWLANNGGKAAIPGINQNDVNAIWIYDLSHPKVQEFGDIAKPMFEQILKNCKQNRQLSLLRDSLLPKLMSRELELGV